MPPLVNIGMAGGPPHPETAEMVKDVVGHTGHIVLDPSKPDGAPRKLLDIARLRDLGWRATVGMKQGLRMPIRIFQ